MANAQFRKCKMFSPFDTHSTTGTFCTNSSLVRSTLFAIKGIVERSAGRAAPIPLITFSSGIGVEGDSGNPCLPPEGFFHH